MSTKKIPKAVISKVMSEMGRKGGKKKNPNKGFGTTAQKAIQARWDKWRAENPEKAAAAEERRKKRQATNRIIAFVLLLTACLCSSPVRAAGHGAEEKKQADAAASTWEYKTVHSDEEVNANVKDGWEVVSMSGSADGQNSYLLKRFSGVIPPKLIQKVEPFYSRQARKRRIQGSVGVAIEVDENGRVASAKVIRSLDGGELDDSAIEAVKQWRFRPGTKQGKPISAKAVVDIKFALQ